jgi:hypothetical protein
VVSLHLQGRLYSYLGIGTAAGQNQAPTAHREPRSDPDRAQRGALQMSITITAFERSPDGGKGLARDTRVRWALEEVWASPTRFVWFRFVL